MDFMCPKVPLGLTPMNFISAVKRMKETENLKAEMIYVDILNEMERIGNDAPNVVHALNHRV
jgi:Na+/phosphate symporter